MEFERVNGCDARGESILLRGAQRRDVIDYVVRHFYPFFSFGRVESCSLVDW